MIQLASNVFIARTCDSAISGRLKAKQLEENDAADATL
jgi:hypothetical protein